MILKTRPGSQMRLRKGDLEKIGIKTEGSVLSGNAGVSDAFDRQARATAQPSASSELQRLRDQLAGVWRR